VSRSPPPRTLGHTRRQGPSRRRRGGQARPPAHDCAEGFRLRGSSYGGGAIRDFHTGVGFGRQFGSGSAETTVSHLELSSNEIGVENQASSASVRIESNTIHDNGDGLTMSSGGALIEIVDNRILGNGRFGLRVLDRGNPPALVQGNLVMRNGATGIVLDTAHTIAIGNTSSGNGGAGIFIFDPNCTHLNFFRLGSNLADGNQGLGIDVELPSGCPPDASLWDLLDAGGNAASRNGDPRECTIHVACARNRGQANKLVRLDPAALLEPPADDEGSRLAETLLPAGAG
jgi:Right handed beta helix region